jgi:hypothetical protein
MHTRKFSALSQQKALEDKQAHPPHPFLQPSIAAERPLSQQ